MTVLDIVYEAIDSINENRSESNQIEKNVNTPLWGAESSIDSLGLVIFSIAIDEKLNELHQIEFDLVSMSGEEQKTVFASVETLCAYLTNQIKAKK